MLICKLFIMRPYLQKTALCTAPVFLSVRLLLLNFIISSRDATWQVVQKVTIGTYLCISNSRPRFVQDLTLTITSERSESELDLEEDHSEISSINVQSFVDEQEWKLHSHVETWKRVTNKAYQNSKHKHPAFSTSCRASRRPGFFIWNIFLVMVNANSLFSMPVPVVSG